LLFHPQTVLRQGSTLKELFSNLFLVVPLIKAPSSFQRKKQLKENNFNDQTFSCDMNFEGTLFDQTTYPKWKHE
jgi:hypothetical protein